MHSDCRRKRLYLVLKWFLFSRHAFNVQSGWEITFQIKRCEREFDFVPLAWINSYATPVDIIFELNKRTVKWFFRLYDYSKRIVPKPNYNPILAFIGVKWFEHSEKIKTILMLPLLCCHKGSQKKSYSKKNSPPPTEGF